MARQRAPDGLAALDASSRRRFTSTGGAVLVTVFKALPVKGTRPGELAFVQQTDGLYLYVWDGASWTLQATPAGTTAHDFWSAQHPDIDAGDTPAVNDVPKYDGTKWKAEPAGAGGGMAQHANEYHEPDMALQSDFAAHKTRH